MRTTLVPAAILMMALIAPAAFAQSVTQPAASSHPSASSAPSAASPSPASDTKLMTQIKVEHSLQQAGFKGVQVLKESFLVQAKTADGTPVVMVINPPSESAAMSSDGSSSSSDSSAAPGAGSSKSATRASTSDQSTSN